MLPWRQGKALPLHAVKTCREVELEVHLFFVSVLRPGRLASGRSVIVFNEQEAEWGQSRSGTYGEDVNKYVTPPDIEPRFLDRSASSLVTVPTTLSRLTQSSSSKSKQSIVLKSVRITVKIRYFEYSRLLYQLLFIQSCSSWWWAAGLLETCRGLLLK